MLGRKLNMLNYNLYLRNILEAIVKIEKTCKSKKSLNNIDIFDMTLMRLQTIGENSSQIPSELKKKYSEIKWKNIKNLRNVISHRYNVVDKELVWKFIDEKIPNLKKVMIKMKKELK